jgi:hypothetical protein
MRRKTTKTRCQDAHHDQTNMAAMAVGNINLVLQNNMYTEINFNNPLVSEVFPNILESLYILPLSVSLYYWCPGSH